MPIAGYESREHITSTIAALRRELANPKTPSHAEAVLGQLGLFEAELERIRAEEKAALKARLDAELRAI